MGQREAGSSEDWLESLQGSSFSLKINVANKEAKYLIRVKYTHLHSGHLPLHFVLVINRPSLEERFRNWSTSWGSNLISGRTFWFSGFI